MRIRFLKWLAEFSTENYQAVLFIAAVISIICAFIGAGLQIRTQWVDMLPESLASVKEFNAIIENFASDSDILVVLEGSPETLKQAAESLAGALIQNRTLIRSVDYRVDREFLEKHGLLLQDEQDMDTWMQLFKNLNLTGVLQRTSGLIEQGLKDESQSDDAAKGRIAQRGMAWLEAWLGYFERSLDGNPSSQEELTQWMEHTFYGETYYFNAPHNRLILFVRPQSPDHKNARQIKGLIQNALQPYPQVQVGLTGVYMVSYEELQTIRGDLKTNSVRSLVLILLIFVLAFRMLLAPLIANLPVIMSILVTLAVVRYSVGYLNLITSVFGIILLGLGGDYSIHILSHVTDPEKEGVKMSEKIKEAFVTSGQGIITGCLTNSLAFFTLMLADFRGLSELGFTTGIGIIICMSCVMCVLPALLMWESSLHGKIPKYRHLNQRRPPAVSFQFLQTLGDKLVRYRWAVVGVMLALTILFSYEARHITFNRSRTAIQPENMPSVKVLNQVIGDFGLSPDGALLSLSTLQQLRYYTHQFEQLPEVAMVDSVVRYLPTVADQETRLKKISGYRLTLQASSQEHQSYYLENRRQLSEAFGDLKKRLLELASMAYLQGEYEASDRAQQLADGVVTTLQAKVNTLGSPRGIDAFQDVFEKSARAFLWRVTDTQPVTPENLPYAIQQRYIGKDGKFLLGILPKEDVWQEPFQTKFLKAVQEVSSRVTGTVVLFSQSVNLATQEVRWCTLASFLTMVILLWLDFKNLTTTLVALIPLIVGVLWMLGILHLCGVEYNVLNIMAIPLILGIGIDNGVHMIRRYLIEGRGKLGLAMHGSGRGILLTSGTNVCGFGALAMSTHPGLASFGLVLTVGLLATLTTTMITLPALIAVFEQFNISLKG